MTKSTRGVEDHSGEQAKDPKQKVVDRKFVGFTQKMLDTVEAEKRRVSAHKGHCTDTEALEGLLLGQAFMPTIENWIAQRQEETGASRFEVLQIALWEHIQDRMQRGPRAASVAEKVARVERAAKKQ